MRLFNPTHTSTPWMGAVLRHFYRSHKERCAKCEHISFITLLFAGERPTPGDTTALCYDCRPTKCADVEPCRTT